MIKISTILPKEITDKYDVVRNSFVIKDKGDISNEFETEVGDVLQNDFIPQVKLKRWSNECNFSVRLIDDELDVPEIKTEGNKIKYIKNKIEAHFYKIEKGFEFDIVLKEKPTSNIQTLEMRTKGLKFYYQPPLTEEITEEQKAKGWTATETDIKDENGNVVCHRPENVVGSYAVYHESKQGNYEAFPNGKNYRAGKAFHWYRIKAWDTTGTEVWCKLNVDVAKGVRTVEIPQDFLDNAVYPVVIDDTFGHDPAGDPGGSDETIIGFLKARKATGSAGTGDDIRAYIKNNGSSGVSVGYALYAGTDLIDNGTTGTGAPAGSSYAWKTLTFGTSPTITAQDYWITIWDDATTPFGSYAQIAFDTGSAGDSAYFSDIGDNWNWDDPITWDDTNGNELYSIYCTYSAGASGPANLKSANGVVKASIKSINGIAIASVKSINGIT